MDTIAGEDTNPCPKHRINLYLVTRFERGRPIRSWQPKRDGERNEALDTFVYAHAALHGLISMGLRLNEEVEGMATVPVQLGTTAGRVIRSAWMT